MLEVARQRLRVVARVSIGLEIILFRMADGGLTAKIELRLNFSWSFRLLS